MIQINVALPSGRSENLVSSSILQSRGVEKSGTTIFGQRFLMLITADGQALSDHAKSLRAAGIQEGDSLIAIATQARLAATESAFALWCCGGDALVTWGNGAADGNSSAVRRRLRRVQQVQATGFAFAAILADGSVVTWDNPDYGGDSSAVQDQLWNVQQVHATNCAFVAVLQMVPLSPGAIQLLAATAL